MTQFDMRSIRKAPAAQISSKAESRKLFEGAERTSGGPLLADRARRHRADDRAALVALVGLRCTSPMCCPRRLRMVLRRRDHRHGGPGAARLPDRRHLPGAGVPRPREDISVSPLPGRWCSSSRSAFRFSPRPATNSPVSGSAASTSSACDLLAFRRGLFIVVRRWTRQGRLTRRTAIVGGGPLGEALACALASQRDSDVRVVGLFDDRGDDRSPQSIAGCVSSAMSTT